MDNQQIQDPTTQGVGGLRGLPGLNRNKEEEEHPISKLARNYRGEMRAINQTASPKQEIGFVGINDSRYDKNITSASQLYDLANTRGELQPWYDQIGAGLAKGAILAGTTFLDGTVGLVIGAGMAALEGRGSALWDNPFSEAMQSINKWSEEALPNYYTNAEREGPWYDNIFTANFLGDKLIKNLGFTVGAFYGGNLIASGMARGLRLSTKALSGGANLAKTLGLVKDVTQFPTMVTSATGVTISAINEGRIEALNNSTDWFNLQKQKLDDKFGIKNGELSHLSLRDLDVYNNTLGKITEDRLKMGNMDLLMNIPILTASNFIQFGKLYANGFKTARKATKIVNNAGNYTTKRTVGKGVARATFSAASEGVEEITQKAAATISGLGYEYDVNNFYQSKLNPEAEQQTVDWIKAFAQGINETVNDGSSWEEFFIGSLTGALGMPKFRNMKNSEGGLQSPITFEGGIIGEFKEYMEKMNREIEISNYLNERIQSPEFLNYYQGLIRHNKYQNDMNQAAENGDAFEFKNAEHAQLISDIVMFDNAGKLDDLVTLINSAYDISDENLASIVENTISTVIDNNGKESTVGPFIDKKGNPMYSTPEGKQEMIDKLTKTKDEMLKTITDYTKIKDEIDLRVGQQISDEQLEELTWLKSQIGNWQDRAKQLSSEIKPILGTMIGNWSQLEHAYSQIMAEEGQAHAGLSELYTRADEATGKIKKIISFLEVVRGLNDEAAAYLLANKPEIVEDIKSIIENPLSGITADEVQAFNEKINDIVKLTNATGKYNDKLKEYLENPGKLQEDMVSATENIVREEINKKSDNLRNKLLSSTNLAEFRQAINEEEDGAIIEETLKTLENEGNEMAKNYREVNSYYLDVQRAINSQTDTDPAVKADALKLLQDQFRNSSNLEEMANPNSIYIDNMEALYDNDLTPGENAIKFQEAQYALLRAISQINNENRFKDRFSEEYRTVKEKGRPNLSAPDQSTTGDSKTATVASITVTEDKSKTDKESSSDIPTPTPAYETPAGDSTIAQVSNENEQLNDNSEDFGSLDSEFEGGRPYYRPAIPELHIQAVKEGDFRAFHIVVKERESKNFDVLYNHLLNSGAFAYVNNGNLKVGDEIGFMIDPELEEKMRTSRPEYKGPTILMINKKDGQIVGSLDEAEFSVKKFEGLKELRERIKAEYAQRSDKTGKFIASPTTKVSKIMVGKIPYGHEEKSLAEIFKGKSKDKAPIFGIVKNGVLLTNDKLEDHLIIKPKDMSNKEGRMYLLIPNAAGTYSPVAIRVKHFNTTEFNPEDIEVQETEVFKNIQGAIRDLANSLSDQDLKEAVSTLGRYLYKGDLHIDWIASKKGPAIKFTKVYRDAQGKEIYDEINGERRRKENSKIVFLTEKWDSDMVGSITGDHEIKLVPDRKNLDEVVKEITEVLLGFNLPIQVNLGQLNEGNYNNELIQSNVLTSNISEATVKSNWFITDYFDAEGNLHKSISPVAPTPDIPQSTTTPVGGTEGVIPGIRINYKNVEALGEYSGYVDLSTNTIRDLNGNDVTSTISSDMREILFDLAWAQNTFGDATQASLMVDNKVLTPSGKVLDRTSMSYLEGEKAQEVRDKIAGREQKVTDSKKIIAQIAENQEKVDKTRTDGEFYYILEEDGQYHKYERVHTRLGSNWIESSRQTQALKDIRDKLVKLADDPAQYNNYLKYLSSYWKVDLDKFIDSKDAKSRNAIVNIIRDGMSGTNSQRALEAGTAVDNVIRKFFTSNDTPIKPDNMSEQAFVDLIKSLTEIRSAMEARGDRFLTDNIVLFHKYADGTRVAGEVDILSVGADGNFRIYDIKTGRYSFHDFIDMSGHTVNYFKNKSTTQIMSNEQYYTLQLSAYKNLFESQYQTPVVSLAILPYVVTYDSKNRNMIARLTKEQGIIVSYNPSVNVPLESVSRISKPISSNSSIPIFNSALEIQDPVNDVLPEYSLEDSKIGYFMRDSKLHKGYLTSIGQINGVEIYMTKIPNMTEGFGRPEEKPHVASNSYMVVFPNGNSITLIENDPKTLTEQQAKDILIKALTKNPQRVLDMSNEETPIFDPTSIPITSPKTDTAATILSNSNASGALATIRAEQALQDPDSEYEDDLDLDEYLTRKIDNESRPVWDREKELAWLDKVLPQLSREGKVKIVDGIIRVGNQGAEAWGLFNKGIITLSKIAAKGTTYHEAFHAVFHLLLTKQERQALLAEAREMYGNKSDIMLEEDMAEGFREYMMARESKGLLNKIKNFFKDLWIKVTNWKRIQPHLTAYYQMINEGKYSGKNLEVSTAYRLRRITIDEVKKSLDEEFSRAKKIIGELNNRRYRTESEAMNAFNNSGVNKDYFYRIVSGGSKNAVGFKIQLLTNKMFDNYKSDIIEELEYYNNRDSATEIQTLFDSLDPDIQMTLLDKGWTKEKFDSISQVERNQAIKCAGL